MNPGAAANLPPALPIDDEAISRGLMDLDAKMVAWIDMVSVVQDRLSTQIRGLRAHTQTRVTAPRPEPEVPTQTVEAPLEASISETAIAEDPGQAATEGGLQDDTPMPPAVTAEAAAESFGGVEETRSDSEAPVSIEMPLANCPTAPEDVQANESTPPGSESDIIPESDEELLRTLDPEMARAIRARFRLFNGKKTIQALIDEYEPDTKAQKRSWWGRKK